MGENTEREQKYIGAEEMNNIKSGCVNGIWMCTVFVLTENNSSSHTRREEKNVNAHLLNSINTQAQASNSSSSSRCRCRHCHSNSRSNTSLYWIVVQFHRSQCYNIRWCYDFDFDSNHTFCVHLEHRHSRMWTEWTGSSSSSSRSGSNWNTVP